MESALLGSRVARRIVIGATLAFLATFSWRPEQVSAEDTKPKETVVVVIDFGDGMQKRYDRVAWKEGMTVHDAMLIASAHRRGFSMRVQGTGATAFLTTIDEVANEGSDKKNWIFEVNEKIADRGMGAFKLSRGDQVVWKFDEFSP